MEKIYCTKNNWYYSDGTKIEFKYHNPPPVWVSKNGIIRLIDYDDKKKKLISKLNNYMRCSVMIELKKISSEDLLQELIDRKVLEPISVGLYKEFELKRKYKNRNKPISFDGVLLLHNDN